MARGFNPFASGILSPQIAAQWSDSNLWGSSDAYGNWKRHLVTSDQSAWNLCSQCFRTIRSDLPETLHPLLRKRSWWSWLVDLLAVLAILAVLYQFLTSSQNQTSLKPRPGIAVAGFENSARDSKTAGLNQAFVNGLRIGRKLRVVEPAIVQKASSELKISKGKDCEGSWNRELQQRLNVQYLLIGSYYTIRDEKRIEVSLCNQDGPLEGWICSAGYDRTLPECTVEMINWVRESLDVGKIDEEDLETDLAKLR